MNIKIRRMEREDIAAAVRIEQLCFTDPWSEDSYRATLLLPYAAYYVAETEGKVIGICGVRKILGEGEISNVAVLPAYRGQAVARRMLQVLLDEARQDEVRDFTLEVRAGNEAAIRLYTGLGFRQEGVRRDFYTQPNEDALIMWLREAFKGNVSSRSRLDMQRPPFAEGEL